MKENIPFNKFLDYVKDTQRDNIFHTRIGRNLYHQEQNERFEEMQKITWEDFENCSKEEMEKIPLGWLYDWTHVTAEYDKQEKVNELYSRYGLMPLDGTKYIKKFEKYGLCEYNILNAFSDDDLRGILKRYLLLDEQFVDDVDKFLKVQPLKDKNLMERFEILQNSIGNTARTYILKVIALKHILRLAESEEMQDMFLDPYWKDIFKKFLEEK